ncbi:MAG: Flp pilus assembly protein CpaB [Chloroflexi bacterium]|nr:Flp pilus assembly protein CpaB [Chloroflexota bacterium]
MEMEYKDTGRRGKFVIVLGVILALAAGGAAFYLIQQAQQQAGQGPLQKVEVVVAKRDIPARKPIEADDVEVRSVPLDPTNERGIVKDPADVIGKILAVTVLQGQIVTSNMFASSTSGAGFSILGPEETVAPDSPAWRAVSISVADDVAVGGLVTAGMTVDLFVTATVNVPQDLLDDGQYYTDRSTKIAFQDMVILARTGNFYIIKVTVAVAEEIVHLASAGNVTFSMALRPEQDLREVDASKLGSTTNLFITRYGLPIPETYPSGGGAVVTLPPLEASPSPSPSP